MCRSAIIRKKTIDCFLFVLTILFSIKSEQCVRITCLIFVDSTSCQQWLFSRIRVNTKRVTRLLLPWRPCLDSKLWTKSRSDIKRAFGKQIISRPERCCGCFLKNNVNIKGRQRVGEIEKRREKCECKTFFVHVFWSFP